MGFRFKNYCYTTENDALGAFLDTYPQTLAIGSTSDISVLNVSTSSVSTGGLITYSLQDHTNTSVVSGVTLQLLTCNQDTPIQPDFFTVTIAFWFAVIFGCICGFGFTKHKTQVSL